MLRINENKYDDINFFNEYKKMIRSVKGLEGAGEWYELEKMMQNFKDKDVLDEAKKMTDSEVIEYIKVFIEDIEFEKNI